MYPAQQLTKTLYTLFRHSIKKYKFEQPKSILERVMDGAATADNSFNDVLFTSFYDAFYNRYYLEEKEYYKDNMLSFNVKDEYWVNVIRDIPLPHSLEDAHGESVIVPIEPNKTIKEYNAVFESVSAETTNGYKCTGMVLGKRRLFDEYTCAFTYYNVLSQDLKYKFSNDLSDYLHYELKHFIYDANNMEEYLDIHMKERNPLLANFEYGGYSLFYHFPIALYYEKTDITDVDEFNKKRHKWRRCRKDIERATRLKDAEVNEQIKLRYSIREIGVSNYGFLMDIMRSVDEAGIL